MLIRCCVTTYAYIYVKTDSERINLIRHMLSFHMCKSLCHSTNYPVKIASALNRHYCRVQYHKLKTTAPKKNTGYFLRKT